MKKYAYIIFGITMLLLAGLAKAAEGANKPAPGYKLNEKNTVVSADGKLRVEQYSKVDDGGDWSWQFWVFDKEHKHGCLLNKEPMPFYVADFYFSPGNLWLVREQKIGSGNFVLYLYKRDGADYVEGTEESLDDMAWGYFHGVRNQLHLAEPDDHLAAHVVKWVDARHLVIVLTGHRMEDFQCVYDTETGKFSQSVDVATVKAKLKNS